MKTASSLCALAAAAIFPGHANALYKCVSNDAVVYQDRPCVTGAETTVEMVVPTFGESSRIAVRHTRATALVPAKDDAALVAVPLIVPVPPPKN